MNNYPNICDKRIRLRLQFTGIHRLTKRSLVTLAIMLVSPWAFAAEGDEWIAPDKGKHIAVSMALGLGSSYILRNDAHREKNAWLLAMIPGLGKEIYDNRPGGTGFSNKDLVADGVGALIGVWAGHTLLRNPSISFDIRF